MFIIESILTAWSILMRNKLRSVLTMLGIIIGVASMIIILAVGAGAQGLILSQVKSLGSNLIAVLPGKSESNGPPAAAFGIVITTLTAEDGKALVSGGFPGLKVQTPYVRGSDTITWEDAKTDATYVGVLATYPNVESAEVAKGRFFSDDEERSVARVAIIGKQVADDLFGDLDPVGQSIKIKKNNFTIIGVMKGRGTSGFQNQDNQIFMPLSTAQKLLLGINYVNFIRLKVEKPEQTEAAISYIQDTLRERHDIRSAEYDDFSVRSTNQGLEALTSITNALKIFLTAIAAISLLVGGIGIMNIMLAAVQERTKEIGLRKAIGAKHWHITAQFLIETMFITLVGGALGIVFGAFVAWIVSVVATRMGYEWDLIISWFSIGLGVGVSVAIGLVFGILPARRASRLDPIEALRYE